MGHFIGRTAMAQVQSLLRGFLQDGGLPFHTVRTGRRDFRVFFTGNVPAGFCFHGHCAAAVEAFNKSMWRELFGHGKRKGRLLQ